MADYDVNLNGLLDASAELRILQSNLRTALTNLDASVAAFCNSNQGESINGYAAAQTKWNAGMDGMEQAANAAEGALIQIHDQYRLSDLKSAAGFNMMG